MVVEKLDEIMVEIDELDGYKLLRKFVKSETKTEGGIAMASGCVDCLDGGTGGRVKYGVNYERDKYAK